MSRHTLLARDDCFTVVVGWDGPLQTFFAQACRDIGQDDDDVLLWLGGTPDEVQDPEDLLEPLRPYAILPDDTIQQLRADRAAGAADSLTPTQRANLAGLRKLK
jgi:hypothetical protein